MPLPRTKAGPNLKCDWCDEKIKRGTQVHSCDKCQWDVHLKCYDEQQIAKTFPKKKAGRKRKRKESDEEDAPKQKPKKKSPKKPAAAAAAAAASPSEADDEEDEEPKKKKPKKTPQLVLGPPVPFLRAPKHGILAPTAAEKQYVPRAGERFSLSR